MAVTFLPFTAFSPGGPAYGDKLADAKNVVPLYGGYFPLRDKLPSSHLISDFPITGAYAHVFPTGVGTASYAADAATYFAGSRTKLYAVDVTTGVETDISRGGGYAAAGEPAGWQFCSNGNDVWAANGLNQLQRRTANAGAFANGVTSTFNPHARFIGMVREYMIAASLSDVGRAADEFAWSDANDATWFDDRTGTRPASLAGLKAIRSRPGQITGFAGGEYGVFYKRRSIHGLQFTGSSDIWRLDEIARGVGCALPGSLIVGRDRNRFFGGDGFYEHTGLDFPQKISPPEIDQLFTDGVHFGKQGFYHGTMTGMSQEDNLMQGFEDWQTGLCFWFYTAGFQPFPASTPLNAGLCYDPQTQAWSRLSEVGMAQGLALMRCMVRPANAGEQTSSDTLRMLFFDDDGSSNSRLCSFSGPNVEAILQTKRQPINWTGDGALDQNRPWALKAVLPAFTVPAVNQWSASPPAVPTPAVTISIRGSNDFLFTAQTDADGGAVSPRTETVVQAGANDWGWLAATLQARVWDITVTFPAGSDWRAFQGLWLSGDPV